MFRSHAVALMITGSFGIAVAGGAGTPERLFTEQDDGAEPAPTLHKIAAELALAAKGKARTLVLEVTTTDEWGCDCPPFVYAPFSTASPDEKLAYVYPIVTAGPDPGAFLAGNGAGTYEFTGSFTKDKLTRAEWLRKRKDKPAAPSMELSEGSKLKQPVFAVDHWCFRPKTDDSPVVKAYAGVLAKMKKAGVPMCPAAPVAPAAK
ncbi:MAG TPA: hypothetical protein VH165_09680 [Kofleriaceae bacterium]|nr:hypothetical protein [Kofleriaceae bacterium]